METEMKSKSQLNNIRKMIEKKIDRKVVGIKCKEDEYGFGFYITVLIQNMTGGRIGFFLEAFKDEDLIERGINGIYKKIKEIEKQNSLK